MNFSSNFFFFFKEKNIFCTSVLVEVILRLKMIIWKSRDFDFVPTLRACKPRAKYGEKWLRIECTSCHFGVAGSRNLLLFHRTSHSSRTAYVYYIVQVRTFSVYAVKFTGYVFTPSHDVINRRENCIEFLTSTGVVDESALGGDEQAEIIYRRYFASYAKTDAQTTMLYRDCDMEIWKRRKTAKTTHETKK